MFLAIRFTWTAISNIAFAKSAQLYKLQREYYQCWSPQGEVTGKQRTEEKSLPCSWSQWLLVEALAKVEQWWKQYWKSSALMSIHLYHIYSYFFSHLSDLNCAKKVCVISPRCPQLHDLLHLTIVTLHARVTKAIAMEPTSIRAREKNLNFLLIFFIFKNTYMIIF